MFSGNSRIAGINAAAVVEKFSGIGVDVGFNQLTDKDFCIGTDGQIDVESRFAQLIRIDIDHNAFGIAGDGGEVVTDNAQIHSGADNEQQIGVLHNKVGGAVADHARPAEVERMLRRHKVDPGRG